MFDTPDISHLSKNTLCKVYEPAEDSFLLLDSLERDYEFLKTLRPEICLEVGSGSGIISTFAARVVGPGCVYFCTDVNRDAVETSVITGSRNNVTLQGIQADLAGPLMCRLENQIDLLLFNPPYVVTPSDEVGGSTGIEASWAGGKDGREVIDRFLPLVERLLSPKGALYLLLLKENKPEEVECWFSDQGLHTTKILSRRTGPELLSVLRVTKVSQ